MSDFTNKGCTQTLFYFKKAGLTSVNKEKEAAGGWGGGMVVSWKIAQP